MELQRNRTYVSRQLQEKAGGVMPAGLFSCRRAAIVSEITAL
jgi:hypothetical protein